MADYYLAPSLLDLRNEINTASPARDHTSDGWIGDASHAARVSDHNPDWSSNGVVRALDVDVDGCDPDQLIAVAIRDPRVEYVISRGKIYERGNGFKPRVYTGTNKHDKHTHISLRHTKAAEKSGPWGFAAVSPPAPPLQSGLSLQDVAKQVIAGKFGNGDARAAALRNAGYDPAAVQAEVNRQLGSPTPPPAGKKSLATIAKEVIAGDWGNNPDRSRRLADAGYNAAEVQAEVNRQLGGNVGNAPTRLSISLLATQVIAGQWSNGPERERRITAAGYDYQAVRAEVNRRLLRR